MIKIESLGEELRLLFFSERLFWFAVYASPLMEENISEH